jgi:hypothetical protein
MHGNSITTRDAGSAIESISYIYDINTKSRAGRIESGENAVTTIARRTKEKVWQ